MKNVAKRTSKILAGLVGFVLLLIVVALVIPFLVDFNQFKPQIQEVVAQNVNAKIDFESARLQIFPKIGVKLSKVVIENTDPEFKGTKLFSVDTLLVNAKLLPLFQKKVVGNVLIDKPEFTLAQKGIKNNLGALAKTPAETPAGSAPQPGKPAAPAQPAVDPKQQAADQAETMKMVKENVLIEAILINNANVTIRDLASKTAKEPLRVEDFNLSVTNIGLERDIKTEITSKIDLKQPTATVSGVFLIRLVDRIKMGGNGLESATFDGMVDLDSMSINAMNAFVKAPGIPLNLKFKGVFKPNSLQVDEIGFNLHNLALQAKAKIENFKDLNTVADLALVNNDLTKLGDVLPQHKQLLVNANINLKAGVDGPLSKPEIVKAFADLTTKLNGSDMDLHLKQVSLKPMNTSIAANSNRLDLGSLLKPFMPETKPGTAPAQASTPAQNAAGGSGAPAAGNKPQNQNEPAPKDFELTPEQKEMLAGADISLKVNLKEILYDKINIKDLNVDLAQKSLIANLNNFSVKGFGGEVKTKGRVDLGQSPIAFENDFNLIDVKPELLMELVKPEHKELLKGKMTIQLAAKGKGTTVPTLNKTLNGNGTFKFAEGELNTPSVAAIMQQEFDKFVTGLSVSSAADSVFKSADKLMQNPMLAKLPNKPALNSEQLKAKYASITKVNIQDKASVHKSLKDKNGKIEIKNGRMYITSDQDHPSGRLTMMASVGLDMSLDGTTQYNTSDGTKKRMLSQSPYANLLFDKNNNLLIEGVLSGTVADPKVGLKLDKLRNQFTDNAKALVEKEVKAAADQYLKQAMGSEKEKIQAELKKKQDELRAKAEEEKKKREAEAKEKAKKDGEKALKGFFKK